MFEESSNSFNPSELEFLCEDERVVVIPNFQMSSQLHFLDEDIGPFEPLTPIAIPLWLAISLKKKRRCKIQSPDWLSKGLRKRKISF